MAELVGVGDRAHGLHQTIGNVEGHHRHGMPVGVQVQRSRLPVDLDIADAAHPQPLEEDGPELADQLGDPLAPIDRAKAGWGLAAAVAVDDHIGGQQADQLLGVVGLDRLEEPPRQLLALAARGLKTRFLGLDLPAGPDRDLAAVVGALADHGRDLLIAVVEHLPQQEHRPLDRAEALQQHQERQRQRVGPVGILHEASRIGVGHQRLGEPGADIALAAHPGRLDVVDGQSGGDSGQPRLG
jgi:hypothetical protein